MGATNALTMVMLAVSSVVLVLFLAMLLVVAVLAAQICLFFRHDSIDSKYRTATWLTKARQEYAVG